MKLEDIQNAIRVTNDHFPQTSLISLENTHNMCFGTPLQLDYLDAVGGIAKDNNLKLHIDGARLFNASVALDAAPSRLVEMADSVTFCLSKGLAAPVGSVICGSGEFIVQARRMRKVLGGGMRQAGIIAASGLMAIEGAIDQIKKDHQNARLLAEGLGKFEDIILDKDKVQTNIIFMGINPERFTPVELVEAMEAQGIRFFATGPNRMRLVTHYGIEKEDILVTLEGFKKVLGFRS